MLFLLLFPFFSLVAADPATLGWSDCFAGTNTSVKLTVNSVYGQVTPTDSGSYLNLTVLGTTPETIYNSVNGSSKLATLFTTTSVLTLNAWSNFSSFCDTLRPPSPLPTVENGDTDEFCPVSPGEFAFSTTVPWGSSRALTTLTTRISAVDPLTQELICIDVDTTPLNPSPDNPYGRAKVIFWATVALTIAYWVLVGFARIVSAWDRGITSKGKGVWARAQSAGFILASAISGERLATSPALLRFSTPSMRDIIFHTQWCATLAMISVQWPTFIYPLLSQTAWATLTYNVTLASSPKPRWNPLSTAAYNPSSSFADQLNDTGSILYINPDVPNTLFTLPEQNISAAGSGYSDLAGIEKFAYSVGIRPQDLFPICMILWLGIVAGVVAVSILIWFVDEVAGIGSGIISGRRSTPFGVSSRAMGTRSPAFGSKDLVTETTSNPGMGTSEEDKALTGNQNAPTGHNLSRPPSRFGLATPTMSMSGGATSSKSNPLRALKKWWKRRKRALVPTGVYAGNKSLSSFHGSILHGNLVRILILFHLPITIFSVWHMLLPTTPTSSSPSSTFFPDFANDVTVSNTSKALAALSFALLSLLIPILLTLRIRFTPTNKLYEETRTLLSLGPLYNHYRPSSQMFFAASFFLGNLVLGITVGAGQSPKSTSGGTAQAIVILVLEVLTALITSIWLPWGTGASMGLISFLFCVSRIIIAVLLVILTPAIDIGRGAAGWVSYGVLVVLALGYLGLAGLLLVKFIEGLLRIGGGVRFDHNSGLGVAGKGGSGGRRRGGYVDTGLLGVIGVISGGGKRRNGSRRSEQNYRQSGGHYIKASTGTSAGLNVNRNSAGSSMMMPPVSPASTGAGGPFALAMSHHNGSNRGSLGGNSTHTGQSHGPPPSVLKPEHALTPYKERDDYDYDYDSEGYDSEGAAGSSRNRGRGGFIMGAWQPSGYAPVGNDGQTQNQGPSQPAQVQTPTKSGFSRVGGGRAHMDSPYAIQQGSTNTSGTTAANSPSTHQFPSFGTSAATLGNTAASTSSRQQQQQRATPASSGRDSPPPPMSQAQPASALPPGAMPPFHVRTKSQTAIIVNSFEEEVEPQTAQVLDAPGAGTGTGSPSPVRMTPGGGSAPGTPRIHSYSYSAGSMGTGGGSSYSRPPSASNQLAVDPEMGGRGNSSSSGAGSAASAPPTSFRRRSATQSSEGDEDGQPQGGKKRKGKWAFLKRHRSHSTDGLTSPPASPPSSFPPGRPRSGSNSGLLGSGGVDDELAGSQSSPGRSFVVVRKPQAQASPGRSPLQTQQSSYVGGSNS